MFLSSSVAVFLEPNKWYSIVQNCLPEVFVLFIGKWGQDHVFISLVIAKFCHKNSFPPTRLQTTALQWAFPSQIWHLPFTEQSCSRQRRPFSSDIMELAFNTDAEKHFLQLGLLHRGQKGGSSTSQGSNKGSGNITSLHCHLGVFSKNSFFFSAWKRAIFLFFFFFFILSSVHLFNNFLCTREHVCVCEVACVYIYILI